MLPAETGGEQLRKETLGKAGDILLISPLDSSFCPFKKA